MSVVNIKKKELNKRNITNFSTWNFQENTLYIGRNMSFYVAGTDASKWQNPFSLKKYTLTESLALYKKHVLNTPMLYNSLEELRGKELGCWCKPSKCHGDILLKMLESK
jgi:hypothetical protein